MKEWLIDYAMQFEDGHIEEKDITIFAEDIADAMLKGYPKIYDDATLNHKGVRDFAIWNVGLVEGYEPF